MKKSLLVCSLLALGAATPAYADFSVNVGAIGVMPNDSSGSLPVIESVAGAPAGSMGVRVNSDVQLGLTIDYKIDENWTIELIAATPFSHEIHGSGEINGLKVGKTKHLPPTLMAQYHFNVGSDVFKPFVGLGLNYTTFFEDNVDPELTDTLTALGVITAADTVDLALSDSFGFAAQAGFNYKLNEKWGIHAMVSYMAIDTRADVRINGVTAESVNVDIDPTVAMIGLRYNF
ncbi:outer membrane protein [Pseudidiomarina indica]|uniref:Outer membrane protein n=1 Tax=Pseudidiomarina indica TaxID=1159017 RepID=A0A1G6ANH3_9GAMM|nr:OmpW family outer membrane protein [Pseudidiomarina indica]SDB09930.1 outer membrane protein [Pseudidiomarina indica]